MVECSCVKREAHGSSLGSGLYFSVIDVDVDARVVDVAKPAERLTIVLDVARSQLKPDMRHVCYNSVVNYYRKYIIYYSSVINLFM